MNIKTRAVAGAVCITLSLATASAMERYFTYTYEPETMPAGALEYEQWVTLRAGRNNCAMSWNMASRIIIPSHFTSMKVLKVFEIP
jgi:hypothetical protein